MKKFFILTFTSIILFSSCKKDEDIIVNEIIVDTTIVNNYNPTFIIQDLKPVTEHYQPQYLNSGDHVAICASSNYVSEDEIIEGENIIKSWGLNVLRASNLLLKDGRYAGNLDERIKGLQEMIDNPNVKAIFFARGGYGASQILPFINWDNMYKNPKWFIGYSDITAFHIFLNNKGFETILGPMLRGFNNDKESNSLLNEALFGKYKTLTINTNSDCILGKATGRLVGGNLSLIYSESGTAFDLNTKDAILFIEDTGEANYSIDRMLLNLQQSGKLTDIKGLIVGDFINNNVGIDLPLNQIIHKYFDNLNIPIIYGFPNGHGTKNNPLILGRTISINIDENIATINFENAI
ncbi:MAG: LD-carboxypeptidase [Bacteroidales bacterium]|nr:LD-carboxypeptidase [Bacteroidales bacterium]